MIYLKKDARINYVSLVEDLNKSYETIRKTITRLEEKGIIKRFRRTINLDLIGYTKHLFLIDTAIVGDLEKNRLLRYLREHTKINYVIECIGAWKIICSVAIKETNELREIIFDLRKNFPRSINTTEFLRIVDTYKQSFEV